MTRVDELRALLARVEGAEGPDRNLDWEIRAVLHQIRKVDWRAPCYTSSLASAREAVSHALPDWWASSGLCSLTGHASIGPDYNGPAAERLKAEWPEERYHEGFHADLKPGDGPHRECLALIAALLSALLAREEAEHGR